jgi:DNA-binding MarR family transcriptional regulator
MPLQDVTAIPAVLADDVGFLLARCGAMAVRSVNQAFEPLGFRARHYSLLSLAAEGAGTSQRAISVQLGLDPSVVVALIDELEQARLVQRQITAADRRTRTVTITSLGQSVLRQALPLARTVHDSILSPLQPRQRQLLVAWLQELLPPADQTGPAELPEAPESNDDSPAGSH